MPEKETSQQMFTIHFNNFVKEFQIKAVCWLEHQYFRIDLYKKPNDIYDLPRFEVIVDLTLVFRIQIFALFILPDHDIYTTYKSSVKNITLTNLIKVLSS